MSITTQQVKDSIICGLPDGRQIEISMVNMEGEDAEVELDVHTALRVLHYYLRTAGKQSGCNPPKIRK